MSYYDDDEKYDDDVYYGEKYNDDPYNDDDEYDEEDEGSSGRSSNIRDKINNPFSRGTSNLPGRSPFSSSSGDRTSSSREDSGRSGSSGNTPFYRSGGSSSGGSSSSSSDSRERNLGSSGSSPFRSSGGSSSSSSRPGGSTFGSSSSRSGSSSSSSPRSPTPSSSSPFSRGSSRDNANKKSGDDKSKSDDKDKSSGGNPLSGVTSRLGGIFGGGGDGKKDAPKTNPKASSGDSKGNAVTNALGGITGRFGRGGGDDKKDEKSSSPGSSRSFGSSGTFNRGSGSNTADKSDKKKQEGGGGFLSGITGSVKNLAPSALLNRGGDKADTKRDSKDRSGAKPSSSGGFGSRFRPGSSGDKPGASSSQSTSSSSASTGARQGFRPPFGGSARSGDAKPGASTADARSSAKAKSSESGGVLNRITQSIPIFGGGASKDAGRVSKTRKAEEKLPRVSNEGLSLDRKLDILGVGLVFAALMLFFSALSADQGAITGQINTAFSQLLGWGAPAVPITMFVIGAWLIIRHFGDEAPTIEIQRLIGIVMAYIGLLLLFQYIETFNDIYDGNVDFFRLYVRETGRGGGIIGTELYLFIIENIGEIGGIFVMIGWFVISIMLITSTSAAELAVIVMSFWRSFQIARQRRAQKRAAAALLAKQQAEAQSISITGPDSAGELPSGLPGLPAMGQEQLPLPIEQRSIPIRMGGQMMTTSPEQQGGAVPALQASNSEDKSSGGLIGGLLGAMPWTGSSKPEEAPAASAATKSSDGGLLGGIFGRKSSDTDEEPKPQSLPQTTPSTAQNVPPRPTSMPPTPAGTQPGTSSGTTSMPSPMPPSVTPTHSASGNGSGAVPATGQTPDQAPGTDQQFMRPAASAQPASQPGTQSEQRSETAQPFSRSTTSPSGTDSEKPSGADRADRLNQLRSGMNRPTEGQRSILNIMDSMPEADNRGQTTTPQRPAAQQTPSGGQAPTPVKPGEEQSMPNPVINVPRAPQAVPTPSARKKSWMMPDYLTLLSSGSEQDFDRENLVKRARIIEDTLQSFGAPGRVVEINTGPVITQFGVEPDYLTARGGKKSRVKVSAIAQLDKDLQLALGAKSIRIEAPVPGKGFVGVEVPNEEASLVSLRDVMESREFKRIKSPLAIALGQSVDGAPVAADLTSMPHLLIAGTTGSGKSVCVNSIIGSLILRNTPETVKFIMVDPKRVELTGYNGIPHLVAPVVVELERIVGVLKWVTREMDERYKKFSNAAARNITDYNAHLPEGAEKMPYIIVIIDELADLMMLAPEETERVITRIAALARATGIHLVIATQRPSVDVVTGLIKANFPARIAFAVASGTDSRVILDQPGADRLLGKGDMLYMSGDSPAPQRLQGVFVSDLEISNMTRYWRAQQADGPQKPITALIMDDSPIPVKKSDEPEDKPSLQQAFWDSSQDDDDDDSGGLSSGAYGQEDELYEEAVELVRRLNKASISLLQRRLRIGYTRASRLIDVMEERGVVGPPTEGSKPRVVMPYK